MADKQDDGGSPPTTALQLHTGFRWLAALLGVAALFFGTLGVFVVERDWGPIALLVVGTLLTVVGMTGRIPSVKWKDSEVNWPGEKAAADAVRDIIESGTTSETVQILNRIKSTSPAVSAAGLSALHFEISIEQALRRALPQGITAQEGVVFGGWRPDVVLENADGLKVPVEIRSKPGLPRNLVESALEAKELDSKVVGALLLVNGEPRSGAKTNFEQNGWTVLDVSKLSANQLKNELTALFKSGGQSR